MEYLTTAQAGAELGVSASRILKLIEAGRLRAEKVGNSWLILPRALAAVRDRKVGYPKGRPRKKHKKT